jgi:periplasmic protein CpxP/Spy
MSTAVNRITLGLVLVIGIVILFSTLAQAQPQRMSVENRVKILKDSLKLSDKQSAKIIKILEDQREEITTALNENRDDRSALQAAKKKIMKKAEQNIKSVLTEDQAKRYDEMIKQHNARMERRTRSSGK